MEVRRRNDNWHSQRRETVISVWRQMKSPQIGSAELRRIQKTLDDVLGRNEQISPAAIARILADEGAELRHPEIIESDALWREAQIENEAKALRRIGDLISETPLRLKDAEALIGKLERMLSRAERQGDDGAAAEARELAIEGRQAAVSRSKNRSLSETVRAEQAEISEWLRIWLQTPKLFQEWLELRKSSPDFRRKFSDRDWQRPVDAP